MQITVCVHHAQGLACTMAGKTTSRPDGSDLCLMLLGKTGHGKSATGNTILGRKEFEALPAFESVTRYSAVATTKVNGRIIKVVDTPGLADTKLDSDESAEAAMEGFNRGISLCPDGFHAIIIVYKFGQRMTNEEKMVIEDLKEMLGANVIREYGILLFTYGDNFEKEKEDMENKDFKGWCQSVKGGMKELMKECDNRCVLFNNKAKDKAEWSRQRDELLRCVDGLQSKGKRYTNWVFSEAKATWETLTKQKKYAKVIDQVNLVLGEISNDLVAAQERAIDMNDQYVDGLRDRLRELNGLIEDMEEPEKKNMENQIKHMDERVLFIKNKAKDDETRQAQLKELCDQNEALKRQQQEQVERYQRDYEKMQNEFSDKITAMMKESDRRAREMYEQLRRAMKKKKRGCVIA